jgi:hypothetical protein
MLIAKLEKIAKNEKRRREQAVKCLDQLTETLAEPLSILFGANSSVGDSGPMGITTIWIPEYDQFLVDHTKLYFRHGTHHGDNTVEYPGFYLSSGSFTWGDDLTHVKGRIFWKAIDQICDWLTNYLPDYIDRHDLSRDERLQHLQKIAEYNQGKGQSS